MEYLDIRKEYDLVRTRLVKLACHTYHSASFEEVGSDRLFCKAALLVVEPGRIENLYCLSDDHSLPLSFHCLAEYKITQLTKVQIYPCFLKDGCDKPMALSRDHRLRLPFS